MVSSHINLNFLLSFFSEGRGWWWVGEVFFWSLFLFCSFQEPCGPGGNQILATLDGRSLIFIVITEFIFSSIKHILSCEGNCGNSLIIDSGFLSLGGFSVVSFLAAGRSASLP